MPGQSISFLRAIAAIIICLSGTSLIVGLWLRELTEMALADALLGAVYIIIGIGLFGQSRFSLCMAILVPAAAIYLHHYSNDLAQLLPTIRIVFDTLIISCSSIALWRERHRPSA